MDTKRSGTAVNCCPLGIRYGVVSMQRIRDDVVTELWYGSQAEDLSRAMAMKDIEAEVTARADAIDRSMMDEVEAINTSFGETEFQGLVEPKIDDAYEKLGYHDREHFIEGEIEKAAEGLQIDEPTVAGTYDDVKYQITWLGGAPLLWVFESPHKALVDLCSPCVPGAGDLESRNPNGYECYDVPSDWLDQQAAA